MLQVSICDFSLSRRAGSKCVCVGGKRELHGSLLFHLDLGLTVDVGGSVCAAGDVG